MKCVVQRVLSARVSVAGEEVGAIGQGALVYACVLKGDGPAQVEWLADRLAHLRCFEDEAGKMNLSALDLGLSLLVVSQFTLATVPPRRPRRALCLNSWLGTWKIGVCACPRAVLAPTCAWSWSTMGQLR